jgi:ribosome biogenesis ATPase
VFTRARSSIPCVLFFDELDALVPRRDDSLSEASARVVNTLLTELDGLSGTRDGIYIIAATNRPETIDQAMLRFGRLETLLFVGLPGPAERVEILKAQLPLNQKESGHAEFAADEVCRGFTGADLGSLVTKAGRVAIREGRDVVVRQDYIDAVKSVRRSVLDSDMERYERLKVKFATIL